MEASDEGEGPELEIRRAEPTDVPELARLQFRCHTIAFREFAEEGWLEGRDSAEYRRHWERRFHDPAPGSLTWKAEAGESLIGTVSLIPLTESSATFRPAKPLGVPEEAIATLRMMFVDPDHLRRGIGGKLMDRWLTGMRSLGHRAGTLITHQANHRARRFYEEMGWQRDEAFRGRVPEFFDEPVSMRHRIRYVLRARRVRGAGFGPGFGEW